MTDSQSRPEQLPRALARRRGRVVFRARRPVALVVPLALLTEAGGVICLLAGATIGWFIVVAPVVALLTTGAVLRPSLELTREGIVQRQYPFSSLTRWETITGVDVVRVNNRAVLGYTLATGTPPPRRQPAAALLRAAGSVYHGGYFADALAADPDEVCATVRQFVEHPDWRDRLPATRR